MKSFSVGGHSYPCIGRETA